MLSNILYKEAAAVAATTALHAAAVAKKRVAKIKGQLKNEAEKWKRWEADYRTQIRYAVERERRKEQQERTDMGLEDCDCKYAWLLEKHHDALKQQLASVQKLGAPIETPAPASCESAIAGAGCRGLQAPYRTGPEGGWTSPARPGGA